MGSFSPMHWMIMAMAMLQLFGAGRTGAALQRRLSRYGRESRDD
jgi:Sec-independent protein translocase protein TatA